MNKLLCPLCHTDEIRNIVPLFGRTFFICNCCELLFADPSEHLSAEEEKRRYETHNNDVNDPRYQEFVRPLVNVVARGSRPASRGLDFGAGTGPVLAKLLAELGFSVELYDPFFWPNSQALQQKYDFIASSEVVEHFAQPGKEFSLLSSLLEPQGFLAIMTLLYEPQTDLSSWYYLKDPTHICAYSLKTFDWIGKQFGFRSVEQHGPRIVVLKK